MEPILAYSPELRAGLHAFIESKRLVTDPTFPWEADFLDRLEPFATGGKLLRGAVVCFSYAAFSEQPPDSEVLDAAMALELAHSALLIHDDIMDSDDLRRGQPSIHCQYRSLAEQRNLLRGNDFGVHVALCGGDIALLYAFELLGRSRSDSNMVTSPQRLFTDQMISTCVGQIQDLYFEACPDLPTKKAIYDLMETKTAAYTIALPLTMGAALARKSGSVLQKLQAIGIAAGTIFQIRDDELGAIGDSQKTGKPVGADIREGKKTLLYYYLMKACSDDERQRLQTTFGNAATTTQDIAYAQSLVRHYRISQLLSMETKHLQKRAHAAIDKLTLAAGAKATLKELVAFCAQRQL